ncbi:MAG: T9SS type A sorting domain-containing protein [Chlorobi bacterium]|nr:T9SS type A sorting domain-containing protein [Chlorobiota bacterium]
MKRHILISILIYIIAYSGFGQSTYFVSASSGNDSNNGTSPISAWQTIDKVNNQTFVPGDIILFKRGDVWTNQTLEVSGYSGTSTKLITFGAYPQTETGKPIISTIVEHPHTWTNQGGNLWKADNPPAYHPERLWVNGTEILRANSFSELDGINFIWLYNAEENGDLFLYADTDPANSQISYTNSNVSLYLENTNYIVFTNINLQGGWTSVFINSNTSYIHFNEMEIGENAANGIDINSEDTSVPNHIHIKNSSFDANFSLDYSMAGTYDGSDNRGCSDAIFIQCAENCEIDSNYFKNWGHASINIDGNPNGSANVRVSYISIHNNYLTSPDICYGGRIGLDDTHNCEVFNNQIINTSVQCQIAGFNNHFHHNIIDGTTNPPIVATSEEISAGISLESYASTEVYENIIENNLIKNTEGAGFRFTNSGFYDMYDNIIRNNIFYNCGTVEYETGIGISIQANTNSCETYNNIFKNNLVYSQNTVNTINFRGTVYDIAGFNNLTGTSNNQITGNISENPIFMNINNSDYHLTENSPCIDAGTATLATQDFDGNNIPYNNTLPDIGIYEYQFGSLIEDNSTYYEDVIIYPNPAKNYINISVKNHIKVENISIYNTSGKIVKDNISPNSYFDISTLGKGIYLIKTETINSYNVTKFLKE